MGNLKALALGLGIALAGALPAQAALIIKADNVTVATSASNDFATFTGQIGSFNINVLSALGVDSFAGNGTLMDNGSLNVATSGAGSLTLHFIQTDLTSPSASLSFFGAFTGVLQNMTITKSFYADATNSGLMTTLLGTTTSVNGTFSSSPVALNGLYSITEVITITATGPGAYLSSDDNVRIPEPISLGLFGGALLALGLVRRRRSQRA